MSPYKPRVIQNALTSKGFRMHHGSSHKKLTLYIDDKKTSVFTFLSHGAKTYDDSLLSIMKKQLRIEKDELCDLIDCPISGEDYLNILIDRGHIQRPTVIEETDSI